jgi:hypothetical protein
MAADGGYLRWRAAVDHQLNEIYCITIEDAGFDEEYLDCHWKLQESPADLLSGSATNMTSTGGHRQFEPYAAEDV